MIKRFFIAAVSAALLFAFSPRDSSCFDGEPRHEFSVSRLSDGTTLRDPLGLGVSESSGDILVADTGNNRIRIFNHEGVLIKSIGRLSGIHSPIGVAIGENEEIYLTETGSPHIKRLDFAGSPLSPILLSNTVAGAVQPGRICMGKDGRIYVADRAAPRVLVVSATGRVIKEISGESNEAESQWKVQDVTVDNSGRIFVISSKGLAVHSFDRDGSHLKSFGAHGSKDDEFSFPTGAAIGPDGNLWIVDSFRQEIKVFTPDGDFLFRWGRTGAGEGDLFYPVDIAFGKGTLYVLEKGASRLQAFELR